MDQIKIIRASIEDYKTLQVVAKEIFYETYAHNNTEENIRNYIDKNFNEDKVKEELSNTESIFFIAYAENVAIGYLKINFGAAQTDLQEDYSVEIERIYVKASHQGKRVGQLLYDQAVETGLQQGKTSIWLGVWEHNPKAIRFYEKNGFVTFDTHLFKMGEELQTDFMMRKKL